MRIGATSSGRGGSALWTNAGIAVTTRFVRLRIKRIPVRSRPRLSRPAMPGVLNGLVTHNGHTPQHAACIGIDAAPGVKEAAVVPYDQVTLLPHVIPDEFR